jgi:hypothetical protein
VFASPGLREKKSSSLQAPKKVGPRSVRKYDVFDDEFAGEFAGSQLVDRVQNSIRLRALGAFGGRKRGIGLVCHGCTRAKETPKLCTDKGRPLEKFQVEGCFSHPTDNRCRSRCGSLLPHDGGLRCRPGAVWLGAGKDVAEISREPFPCRLTLCVPLCRGPSRRRAYACGKNKARISWPKNIALR